MSNKKDKNFNFKEELINELPEDLKPKKEGEATGEGQPRGVNPLEDSFADIFEATGVRDIVHQILH